MPLVQRWLDVGGLVVGNPDDGYRQVPSTPAQPSGAILTAAAEVQMPYHVTQDAEGCDGWAVVKDDDGEIMGCHDTEGEANDQMAALYASEGDSAVRAEEWHAIFAPEGVTSGDGREFVPGSLEFRDLPIPLRYVEEDVGFHDGAVAVGSTTRMERINGQIHAWGFWDLDEDNPLAAKAKRQVDTGVVRWVSVDVDDVSESDVELVFPEPEEGQEEDMLMMPELVRYHHGRIAAGTIVQIPAFQEAVIENIDPTSDSATGEEPEEDTLAAAAEVVNTGAMVALVPDAETTARLAVDGGLEPDDLHMTLIYMGDAVNLDETARQAVLEAASARQRTGAIETNAFGAALFNPTGDEPAVVMLVDGHDPMRVRAELMPQVEHLIPDDAHAFIPHTTLAYPSPETMAAEFDEAVSRTGPVRYDRLRVAFGDQVTDYPLDVDDLSLVASAFPVQPPDEWFQNPGLQGPTPFTVEDSGRVYGHLATWNTCHTSIQGACRTPPHEDSFDYFQLGEVVAASGARIPVGTITMGCGHAGPHLRQLAAAAHYDDVGTGVADVVAGTDEHGIWFAGAARPGMAEPQLRQLRAAKLSGDWRKFASRLRLVAALCVNVPGFPVPRGASVGMAKGEQVSLAASGVVLEEEHARPALNHSLLADHVAASIGRDPRSLADRLAAQLGR